MKMELDDIILTQSEMLNALLDYKHVLDLPNCNSCVRGLDICPGEGDALRINCPAFFDKKNGERPHEPAPDFMNLPVTNDVTTEGAEPVAVESGVTEKAEGPNCPDDPKLRNYLKH